MYLGWPRRKTLDLSEDKISQAELSIGLGFIYSPSPTRRHGVYTYNKQRNPKKRFKYHRLRGQNPKQKKDFQNPHGPRSIPRKPGDDESFAGGGWPRRWWSYSIRARRGGGFSAGNLRSGGGEWRRLLIEGKICGCEGFGKLGGWSEQDLLVI